jgi:hypothetical protein
MAVLASANHPRAIVALVIGWVAHGVRLPGASSVACMYGRGVLEDSVQDPARPGATIRIVIAEVVAVVVAPALVLCALGVVPRVTHPVAAWAGARTWATGALTPLRTALRARHVTRGAHLLQVGVAVDRLGEEALERTAARRNTGSGVRILRGRQGYRGLIAASAAILSEL